MHQSKGSPVLMAGIVLGAAALAMACGSSNNNNGSKATTNNAATTAATTAPASATSGAATSAAGAASPTKAAATTTTAASPAASAAAAPAKPTDLATDDQQKITFNLGAEPVYLDPHKSEFQQDVAVEHLLWRGLFYFDTKNSPVPAVAASVPTAANGGISADGLTYTIKLKPGQKFSDGNPLTAKDFEYSIKRMLNPKTAGSYASFYTDIVGADAYNSALDKNKNATDADLQPLQDAVGVKAMDDTTIQFKLTGPSASFTTRLAIWSAYPVEKAAIDKMGDQPMDVGNLVGNGPYILKEHVAKDHITLAVNPNYTAGPAPYIKSIVMRDIEDPVQALNAYKNGELDYAAIPVQQAQSVFTDPSLKDQVKREPIANSGGLEFNVAHKPFDNAKVREAFVKAVDGAALVQVVYSGTGVPGTSWLPPGLPGYDKANEAIAPFDVTAAKKALSDAGFPNGQGFPSDVKFLLTDNSTNKLIFDFVSKALKDNLNITVSADLVDSKTRSSRYSNKDFQMVFGGWNQDYPNADDWLPTLFGSKGSNNDYSYSSPAFDDAVAKALKETDPAKQAPLWSAAEKIVLGDFVVGIKRHGEILSLWKPKIKGMVPSLEDSIAYGDEFMELVYVGK